MSRTTKAHLQGTLERLASSIGVPVADLSQKRPVGLYLDHNASYGGWKVVRINADTSESDVFGASRCSASEMWDRMSFAIRVLGEAHRAAAAREA